MARAYLLLLFLALATISTSYLPDLLPEIQAVIEKAKQNIWDEIEPTQPVWNMPPWLGTMFLSEYYFFIRALQFDQSQPFLSQFNQTFFTNKLLNEQLSDGSWKQLIDQNRKSGSLDATIFNYWYLKEVGVDMSSTQMSNARKFILDHGGLEKAQVMTLYKLAIFGQYEWTQLNYIPLFLFKTSFPFYSYGYIKDYVAQWVYPHILGLAYLRYHKTIFPVSKVCISELLTSRGHPPCDSNSKDSLKQAFNHFRNNDAVGIQRDDDVDNVLKEMISLCGREGLFGAYTVSTLLSLMSFKDYSMRYNATNNAYITFYQANLNKSLAFVESLYFNRRVPYEGSLDDGRYWDTILAVFALLQAGQTAQKLNPTMQFLIKNAVQQNGGIPYGLEFQYVPDIDDTAMLVALYGKMKQLYQGTQLETQYIKEANRSYQWIKSNQNSDGGFPAFHKNKNDGQYKLLSVAFWATGIDKSAQIFDPSCPDIVGHLLEAMGEASLEDLEILQSSIQYLLETRKDGMWSARWGINYVYAVGAVFPGLLKIGYDMRQEWITNVTKRLQSVQQEDGGFGENYDSYNKDRYIEGVTTASMTAWGLLGYLSVSHTTNIQDAIERAARYLIDNFRANNDRFWDRSVVGTGHRGLLNLQYPVYAYSFPLVALSRLREYIKNPSQPKINQNLMNRLKQKQGDQL